jgi:error-prone DNA polymerase
VANVITYRARSSVRDMAKALGFAPASRTPGPSRSTGGRAVEVHPTGRADHEIPPSVLELAAEVEDFPATSASTRAAW